MTSSVNSRISPKRYESLLSEIEEEDQNIKSDLYELSIYDHTIHISPGKTIEDDEIKDLVYCYVYAVKNDKVVQKLGVYEKFTKEKEEFFDLSTFDKGTLCLFEKYETNPSLFVDLKVETDKPKVKPPKKSKKAAVEEPVPVEVDLNAEEPPKTKPKTKPKAKAETKEPVEVDLNAEEPQTKQEPVEVDLNAEEPVETPKAETPKAETPKAETKQEPVEVDLNAEEPVETPKAETKAETKPKTPTPTLLDVNELERDLGKKKGTKIKLKSEAKAETPKAETKAETPKAETPEAKVVKPKTSTKKTKPKTIQGEAPGTKFG